MPQIVQPQLCAAGGNAVEEGVAVLDGYFRVAPVPEEQDVCQIVEGPQGVPYGEAGERPGLQALCRFMNEAAQEAYAQVLARADEGARVAEAIEWYQVVASRRESGASEMVAGPARVPYGYPDTEFARLRGLCEAMNYAFRARYRQALAARAARNVIETG